MSLIRLPNITTVRPLTLADQAVMRSIGNQLVLHGLDFVGLAIPHDCGIGIGPGQVFLDQVDPADPGRVLLRNVAAIRAEGLDVEWLPTADGELIVTRVCAEARNPPPRR